MFSELIRRNSKRNRQENTLYFVTMILTVAAFYIILALDHQDVMIFLKEMERDAVNKLLMLIDEIHSELLLPRKEKISGSPQSLLCGEKEYPRSDEPFGIYGESDKRSVM